MKDFCSELLKKESYFFFKIIIYFLEEFFYANPLHADLFPACRQMEAELISMTGDLFGQGKEACGCITSGGTESIGMAMLTYRNWARDTKGIKNPEL
jgi:sphinganine-1-phosphate aldolase